MKELKEVLKIYFVGLIIYLSGLTGGYNLSLISPNPERKGSEIILVLSTVVGFIYILYLACRNINKKEDDT